MRLHGIRGIAAGDPVNCCSLGSAGTGQSLVLPLATTLVESIGNHLTSNRFCFWRPPVDDLGRLCTGHA